MFRPSFQFISLIAIALITGMVASRTAVATDIASPAVVSATDSPILQLNQTNGLAPYQWNLVADDIRFHLSDVTGGYRWPFIVENGSADGLLQLVGNRIGIGTGSPGQQLHLQDGWLRFDDSGGTPQTWDVQPNSVAFSITDVTNLKIPFQIIPGAPHYSLYVASDGKIGLGTSTPTAAIHVRKPAQASTAEMMARFETTDDPVGGLFIANSSAGDGVFIPKITGRSASQNAALINEAVITNDLGASPAIAYNAVKGAGGALVNRPLVTYRNNNVAKVTIAANGNVIGTSFVNLSSRDMKDKITDLSSEKASAALQQLRPVEFVYKDDETADPRIGFIAEDVPDLIAEPDRKSVPVMDVLALLTRVVKDQQQTIDKQQNSIDELSKRLAALESQAAK